MIDVKLVLGVSKTSSTSPCWVLSRGYSIPNHLLLYQCSGGRASNDRLSWIPLLLALRGESIFIDLPIVIEIIEHQVKVVVNFLCQMVNDSLLSVNNNLYVVLLNQGIAISRPHSANSARLRCCLCSCIGLEIRSLRVHIVAE